MKIKIIEKLSPIENDMKVIAKYFINHGGCNDFICSECPLYHDVRGSGSGCEIDVGKFGMKIADVKAKEWAIEYLDQIKKLEFLEKLK